MIKKIVKIISKLIYFLIVAVVTLIILYYISNSNLIKNENLKNGINSIINTISNLFNTNPNKIEFVQLKDENLSTEIEKAKNYYYLQLSKEAKTIYVILEENIENFKNGVEKVSLSEDLNEMLKTEQGQELVNTAFQDAWDAFSKDKPELFYFDVNKFCLIIETSRIGGVNYDYNGYIGKNGNANYFVEGFESAEDITNAILNLESFDNQIKQQQEKNDYEKILWAHDWIVQNIEYDTTYAKGNNGNIYGAILEKDAVCEGYAKTFKYIMDKLNVPCVLVCGIGTNKDGNKEKHAWNYVYLNKNWYAIDTTWDDPVIIGSFGTNNKIRYDYFLKGSKVFYNDHSETGIVSENGKRFTYPELSAENFK